MDISLRVKLDQVADCIPVVSLASNLIVLFQKSVFIPRMEKAELDSNPYYRYINQKSYGNCRRFAIPFYGNYVAFYHHFRSIKASEPVREPIAEQPSRKKPVLRNPQLTEAQQQLLQEARMNYDRFFKREDTAAQACQGNRDFLLALITAINRDLIPIPGVLCNDRDFGTQVLLKISSSSKSGMGFARTFAPLMQDEEFLLDALTLLTTKNVPFYQEFVREITNDRILYVYLAKDDRLFESVDPKYNRPFLRKVVEVFKKHPPSDTLGSYGDFGKRVLTKILDDQNLVAGDDAAPVARAFTETFASPMADPDFHLMPLPRVTRENLRFFQSFVAALSLIEQDPFAGVCSYLKKDADLFDELPKEKKQDVNFLRKAVAANKEILKKVNKEDLYSSDYTMLERIADPDKWIADPNFSFYDFNREAPDEVKKDPKLMLKVLSKVEYFIDELHPDLLNNVDFGKQLFLIKTTNEHGVPYTKSTWITHFKNKFGELFKNKAFQEELFSHLTDENKYFFKDLLLSISSIDEPDMRDIVFQHLKTNLQDFFFWIDEPLRQNVDFLTKVVETNQQAYPSMIQYTDDTPQAVKDVLRNVHEKKWGPLS